MYRTQGLACRSHTECASSEAKPWIQPWRSPSQIIEWCWQYAALASCSASPQMGQFVDPGAPLGEVLADLERLGARSAQMTAKAKKLAELRAALGHPAAGFLEVEAAATAVQVGKRMLV